MKLPISMLVLLLLLLLTPQVVSQDQSSPGRDTCHNEYSEQQLMKSLFGSLKVDIVNPMQSYCNWDGVECDPSDCKVSAIVLLSKRLTGKISEDIAYLTKLRKLDLSGNHLGGNIPRTFGLQQGFLRYVNLSSNNLGGPIPPNLVNNCDNLEEIDLENNKLDSQIPNFPRCSKLKIFAVRNNQFGGDIPSGFGNLQNLTLLDLSFNHLNGIPDSFRPNPGSLFTTDLRIHLSNNSFSGSIPEGLFNLSSLSLLDLSNNQFSGVLPEQVGALSNLSSLNVSHNSLSGEIPRSILNCTKLQSLDLSFNDFKGQLPDSGIFCNGTKILLENTKLLYPLCKNESTPSGSSSNHPVQQNNETRGTPTVPEEQHNTSTRSRLSRSAVTAIVLVVIILFLLALVCLFCKQRFISQTNIGGQFKRAAIFRAPPITYADLETATKGFSPNNLIGSGYIASVYKGILLGQNKAVAVKVLNRETSPDEKRLIKESHELRNITHTNVVTMLTSCEDVDTNGNQFAALVYQLMPRGNLEMWLHEEVVSQVLGFKKWNLSWFQRLNMAIDVAYALEHLHCKLQNPIVHCHLKPSNILVAEDMTALVTDFGMDRIFPLDLVTRKCRGYIAPECAMGKPISTMWDVYSFGVILLEMFTGKRPTNEAFHDGLTLHNYVLQFSLYPEEIIDPLLISEETGGKLTERALRCIGSIIQIALVCSNESPDDRMEIAEALEKLQNVKLCFLEIGTNGVAPQGLFNRVQSTVAMLV